MCSLCFGGEPTLAVLQNVNNISFQFGNLTIWQLATGNWHLKTDNWQLTNENSQIANGNWKLETDNWQLATRGLFWARDCSEILM